MKKIVLIEDDADLYSLIQYNLEKEGFAMVGAQTGKGAIELCRRERPDLIILDIMLPDSDGLEICKGGGRGRARTCNPQLRRLMLYPIALRARTLAGGLHKSREELETSAGDARTLELILARLGLVPSFRYEKFRTTFRALEEPGVLALDETPIGVFIELEGPAYWIDATALRMGFKTRDYVVASYAALYRDFLATRQGSPDMLFQDHQRP
jgi:CheY-like chemotaxis protein